jgi:hypothetical protein
MFSCFQVEKKIKNVYKIYYLHLIVVVVLINFSLNQPIDYKLFLVLLPW